ncbi:MAG: sulfatase-like hydrolase/transferase [Pseudomonadota bacterium]
MTSAKNLLIIMSDEHAADALGCAGHPHVMTPTLDALAARGTRFSNAYTPSPICVPARAAFHTGHAVHQTGYWSSAQPYDGRMSTWGHAVRATGRDCVSIGKLHFRSTADDNGFSPEILPMHVMDGIGWSESLLRDPMPDYSVHARELADDVGRGESSYTAYDRAITQATCDWLSNRANTNAADGQKPWTLFVSLVSPHYPLSAPEDFFDLYDPAKMNLPRHAEGHLDHPILAEMRDFWCYGDYFDEARSRAGRAAYYGLISFLDANIAKILDALDRSGAAGETDILYTSDHGELLGNHGFWTKSLMYEESVRVPMILAGRDLQCRGEVCEAPVSLLDLYPTVLEAMAAMDGPNTDNTSSRHTNTARSLGRSLYRTLAQPDPDRTILSEYHDGGSPTGFFMVRWQRWKFIYYVGARPQLFDLVSDPYEENDLGTDRDHADVRDEGERRLRVILDPEAVNTRAFADQRAKLESYGGRDGLADMVKFNHTPVPTIDG